MYQSIRLYIKMASWPLIMFSRTAAIGSAKACLGCLVLAAASSVGEFSTAGVVGGGVGLLLIVGILVCAVFKKNKKNKTLLSTKQVPEELDAVLIDGIARVCVDAEGALAKAMDIPGVMKGDVFTRATAHAYSWVRDGLKASDVGSIEAGINDHQLDRNAAEQILLLQDGLLGRGATALVFKCLWPSRFGETCALAIKVLKDGYDFSHETLLQSFTYEASVLASLYPPHRNVVRLYGYCLEPPTVCFILELLPLSLKAYLSQDPALPNIHLPPKLQAAKDKQSVQLLSPQSGTMYVTSSSETHMTTAGSGITTTLSSSSTGVAQPLALPTSTNVSGSATTLGLRSNSQASAVPSLNMLQVCKISLDIAAGLRYLHSKPVTSQAAAIEATHGNNLTQVQEEQVNLRTDAAAVATNKASQIVHRDLKPANILLNSQGIAKISDFGLARPLDQETLLTDHIGAGTLPYMAPELLLGAQVKVAAAVGATNHVDIYSTAMIMWEMLAGRSPWSNMAGMVLQSEVLNGRRPELPIQVNDADRMPNSNGSFTELSSIPAALNALPEFNAIIRACWQQRHHRRLSAEELYDALCKLLEKHGVGPNACKV